MSDTMIFGRKVSGALKSVLIYTCISLIISISMTLGQAFLDMEQDKWAAMWVMKKAGWWFLLIGNILGNALNTFKAATSNSTRPTSTP